MAKDYAKVYRGENVMKRGIATYKDEAIFLSQDTLHRDMETLKGRPVVIKHQDVTPENMEEKAVGYVTETFYNNEAGTFGCKFVIFDDEAKELIRNGYSLSTCYKPTSFGAGGTEINTPYDREVTGLNFTHLALVPDPRYEDAKIYENGIMEMEEENIENENWKTLTDKDGNYYAVDLDFSKKLEEASKKIKIPQSYKDNVKDYNKIEHQKEVITLADNIQRILFELKQKNDKNKDELFKRLAEDRAYVAYHKKQVDKFPQTNIYRGEEYKTIEQKYKDAIKAYKDNAIIEEQERKNTMENEKMEIPVSFFDKVIDLICNSKKEKKNEDKEIEDVIEEEQDDEMENKCKKNEVVDKRDIIRQIMAIAGKKEASEDVKTIAKLAEKLAYDKDEAEKENAKEEVDVEYNNDEFFNALELAKSLGEADKLPVPETQAKQIERGKEIFG